MLEAVQRWRIDWDWSSVDEAEDGPMVYYADVAAAWATRLAELRKAADVERDAVDGIPGNPFSYKCMCLSCCDVVDARRTLDALLSEGVTDG